MRNLKIATLFIVVMSSMLSLAASWDERLPLSTPEEQAKAFLTVRALIPSMTDGGVRYEFDPVSLFNSQIKIDNLLSQSDEFKALKESHRDLLLLKLMTEQTKSPQEEAKKINWENELQSAKNKVYNSGFQSEKSIESEVEKILNLNLIGKSQGVFTGLSNLLPPEIRKSYFSASSEQKLTILLQNLPEEIIQNGFSAAKFGWSDLEISKHEIIKRLEEILAIEKKLNQFLFALIANQKNSSQKIEDFHIFKELKPFQQKALTSWMSSQINKLRPAPIEKSINLLLREVPPVVGMFRGFAGNDCSTKCSFPFVNSPNESTFLVYDSSGKLKGYVQGTRVSSQDQNYFYLHTISGPRISIQDATKIISAFSKSTSEMKVSGILLPPLEKILALINFIPVREAYKKITSAESVAIQYQDVNIRRSLKYTFKILKNYDDAEANEIGFKANRTALDSNVEVQFEKAPSLDSVNTQIPKNELFLAILQMGKQYIENTKIIAALANDAHLPLKNLIDLINATSNFERYSTEDFVNKFSEKVKLAGFDFAENYFQKNISTIAHGLLKSYDLPKNKDRLIEVIENLLNQREIATVADFTLRNPHAFKINEITSLFFQEFYRDIHEAEFQDTELLNKALEKNLRGIVNNSDLLKVLATSPKATEAVVFALSKNPFLYQVIPLDAGDAFIQLRQQKLAARDQLIKDLKKTTTEMEYILLVNSKVGIIKNLVEQKLLIRQILTVTLEHYISLNPTHSTSAIYDSIAKMEKDEVTESMLRKILPTLIKSSQTHMLNRYLGLIYDLRKTPAQAKSIDRSVELALANHTESDLKDIENLRLFPKFKYRGLLCEKALSNPL